MCWSVNTGSKLWFSESHMTFVSHLYNLSCPGSNTISVFNAVRSSHMDFAVLPPLLISNYNFTANLFRLLDNVCKLHTERL